MLWLALACSDYELKSPADVGVGADTARFCEDIQEPDYAVTPDENCIAAPAVGTFNPVIEWQWTTNVTYPGYDDLMATPAIGNLTDDNGDGLVNQDDVPDIVFTSFAGGAYTSAGTLTAISGDDGSQQWSVTGGGGYSLYASAGVAIGDLEGDGVPEVCTAAVGASVICFEVYTQGAVFKWAAGTEPYYVGAPAFADMDGDGRSEVIFGREIFDSDGNLLGKGEHGIARAMTFAVDMDDDGQLEVVAGNAIYEMDGSAAWSDGGTDGMTAVADFNLNGQPELVRVGGSVVQVLSPFGDNVAWTTSVPGGGGGAPTVADFDGDGLPEVGVAGLAYYTVFDTDGTVMWSNPVSDYSSSVTGSSVFDFEGDGDAEVVYADEHTLWIFEGATGAILMAQEGHASGTLFEFPLIADVDLDGSTEIIVASNNYAYSGWNGITVIGDADQSWAPARPIWNQVGYHITNVNDDGTIPAVQQRNWETWNSFRAGGTILGPSHWQVDLQFGDPVICTTECDQDVVYVSVPVENIGLLDAVNAKVDFDGQASTTLTVPSGEALWIEPVAIRRQQWEPGALRVYLDPDGALNECDVQDNALDLGPWPCD
jgi:hypothetical protein